MIYVIDDKVSRQRDYGWESETFSSFADCICTIHTFEGLKTEMNAIVSDGNVILYHESFHDIVPQENYDQLLSFEKVIKEKASSIYVAHFSGSIQSRWIDDDEKLCTLGPEVLYANLETFARHYREGDLNLRYLLFGENYELDKQLVSRYEEIIDTDLENQTIDNSEKVFFAANYPTAVTPPFRNCVIEDSWEAGFDREVTDVHLDALVKEWFTNSKYDVIYIPLCFGPVWSDFLGLRLAMHIRFTETVNRYTPIFIYGVTTEWRQMYKVECADILRTKGVCVISVKQKALADSLCHITQTNEKEFHKDLAGVHMNIPSDIGDNHSVANKWAIHRWLSMIDWEGDEPKVADDGFKLTLYFKYLEARYGKHDKFSKNKKYSWRIQGIKDKTIVYIDDEYQKGWESILRKLFEKNEAKFICYHDFSKSYSQEELIEHIRSFADCHPADCYLVELRLHETDNNPKMRAEDLTGQKVISYLLGNDKDYKDKGNKANKIIVFTASNKVWNLALAERNGAFGYVVKESPDLNYSSSDTLRNYMEFVNLLKDAMSQSYIRDYIHRLNAIPVVFGELDAFIDQLIQDKSVPKTRSLKSLLLKLIVFTQDYVKARQKFRFPTKDKLFKGEEEIPSYTLNSMLYKRGEKGSYNDDFKIGSPTTGNNMGWDPAEIKNKNGEDNRLSLVEAAVHFYYHLDNKLVRFRNVEMNMISFYCKMNSQRNLAAHETRPLDISLQEIRTLFEEIVLPMIEHDYLS